jgi:hypothetical protein
MPKTFNGIGSTFYGSRDNADDGSYVTTEFLVFCYIPILPLSSYRVFPVGKGTNSNWLVYRSSSQEYHVKEVPLNLRQIVNVYATAILVPVVFFGFAYLVGAFD